MKQKYFYSIFLILISYLGISQTQIGTDIDGEAADDRSGISVSLSSDGTTVAMSTFANGNGKVRVFKNLSGTWTQIGNEISRENNNSLAVLSISLSYDGTVMAIGDSGNDANGTNSGHVRVYRFISGNWTQIGDDINGESAEDSCGLSVSLSADGTIVAIGAPYNDGNGQDSGHVRIYQNSSGVWTQIGTNINGEAPNDYCGSSVSLSADGNTLAISSPYSGLNDEGQVRIFKNISGFWTQYGNNINGLENYENFGNTISLSADGTTIAIGKLYNLSGSFTGKVQVFKNISGAWTQQGADILGESQQDQSSWSISLSADGTKIAISSIFNAGNGHDSGHVRVFQFSSGTWTQIKSDINGEAAEDQSGYSISLSADGSTVAIGAPYNDKDESTPDSGQVRVFVLPDPATHLNFDGINDNVTLGLLNVSSYTKEAWIYSNSNGGHILSSESNSFWIDSNGLLSAGNAGNQTIVQDTAIFPANTWTHVAVTYNASTTTMKLYKNGILVATNTTAPAYVAENNFIGSKNGTDSFFQGNIDEVRIWNIARTAEQIAGSRNCELQGTEAGLLNYYKFNQGLDAVYNTQNTTLEALVGTNGTLANFTLTNVTSNWLAGSPITTGIMMPFAPTVTSPITYSLGAAAIPLTATLGTGATGIVWYTSATGGTGTTTAPTPVTSTVGSTSYWVSSINANGCESDRTEIVIITQVPIPAPTTNWVEQVYTGDDKTLADLQITGTNIKWYASATSNTVLPNTTLLVDESTYYATQTINTIESRYRLAIKVNRISENTQMLLPNSTVANLVATPSTETAAQWFSTSTANTALVTSTTLSNGTYYVEQSNPESTTTLASGLLNEPYGIAVDNNGRIYVAVIGNTIKRMDADGTNIIDLGSGFNNPGGIAIDTDGTILVADTNNNAVKRMNADGTNIVTLGSGFNFPSAIAIDSNGRILIVDANNNAIKRMNADGTNIVTLGNGFSFPQGIAIDIDGSILVADSNNNAIKRMNADGTNIVTLGSGFSFPMGVVVNSDESILVADVNNNAIKRMNYDGSNIINIMPIGTPTGIVLDADKRILVSSYNDNAVKRLTLASTSNRVPVNVDVTTLNTTDFNNKSFSIYPNPSTGIYTIETNQDIKLEVYDMVGKFISKKEVLVGSSTLDLLNYADGVYLIKATNTAGDTKTYKVVKQ